MATLVGHRRGAIAYVGDVLPTGAGLQVLPLPAALEQLDHASILRDYVVRGEAVVPLRREGKDARVAMVGVWDVPCGIATYTRALVDQMQSRVTDVHLFAEREGDAKDTAHTTRCWKRGESLSGLVAALRNYAPDVIYIQHEYGNFPRADHWLALMGALSNIPTHVTLHSVYNHLDKSIVEASCPSIVVHTAGARDTLRAKGVASEITVIPHGCHQPTGDPKLWNLYATPHTILQFGFGFGYKGWDNAIRATALLRARYPDVFFTGLLAERWKGAHAKYLHELLGLAEELGIADRVGLIRGFQSDLTLDSFLRVNRCAIFPYRDNGEHNVYGCSGAARLAMSRGVPVVASGVHLFEDLDGTVARPTDVAGWAAAVSDVFETGGRVGQQDAFLREHSWTSAADRYIDLI